MLVFKIGEAGYQKKTVLRSIDLHVCHGDLVAIIGPNGAGKSTLLKSVIGLADVYEGKIIYEGNQIQNSNPAERLKGGIVFVPQGHRAFDGLTVLANLRMGAYLLHGKDRRKREIDRVLNWFPELKRFTNRKARSLSGGEKQILSLAMGLVSGPKLLLLDEPSLGLTSKLTERLFKRLLQINENEHVTILFVEQKVSVAIEFSEIIIGVKLGSIQFAERKEYVEANPSLTLNLFSV